MQTIRLPPGSMSEIQIHQVKRGCEIDFFLENLASCKLELIKLGVMLRPPSTDEEFICPDIICK